MSKKKLFYILLAFLFSFSIVTAAEFLACPEVSDRSDCFVNDVVNGQVIPRMYKYDTTSGVLSPLLAPTQINSEALTLSNINFNDLVKKESTPTLFLPVLPSGARKGITILTYATLEALQEKVEQSSGEEKTKAQQELDEAIEEARKEVSVSAPSTSQVQKGTVGAKVEGATVYEGCRNKRFGLVGASNTVDEWEGKPLDPARRNVNIIQEFCPGATVFLKAVGGANPEAQASLLEQVLANDNLDYVIIDPSANGQGDFSGWDSERYTAAAIKLAEMVKEKDSDTEVIMLTNTPTKGAAGGYGTPTAVQRIKDFNADLLDYHLGREDLIDYPVDTYSAIESSPGSDTCGYCGNDKGGLGDGIHFGPTGRKRVMKAVMDKVFGAPTTETVVTNTAVSSTSSTMAENCLDKNRCDEIDKVWLFIVKWINSARNGQIYDTIKGWRPFQETRPSVVITPTVPKPSVPTNFCVATYGTNEQKALLDTIAWAEGTREKYSVMFGGKQFTTYSSHPVETGEMPPGGISAGGYTSTAAGRYQFLYSTYKNLKGQGFFQTSFKFEQQDQAALDGLIIKKRGLSEEELRSAVNSGNFELIWDKLAPEWASLPCYTTNVEINGKIFCKERGKSFYGQPFKKSSDLINVYQTCLQYHKTGGVPSSSLPSTGEAKFSDAGYTLSGGGWLCPENAPQPNAGLNEAPGEGNCPSGMVQVNNFCIDKYEASLVKMDGTPWSPYCDPKLHNVKLKAVSLANAVSQSNINQIQAKAACENAGKRLCTDEEWSRACQGPQRNLYPYGSTLNQNACNRRDSPPHVVPRLISEHQELFPGLLPPPGGASAWNKQPYMQHPVLNQQSNTLTRTGEKTECKSVEGVYDLYGNVYEWTSDPEGTFRGDYYQFTPRNPTNEGCLNKVSDHASSYSDYSLGFRCCANPTS